MLSLGLDTVPTTGVIGATTQHGDSDGRSINTSPASPRARSARVEHSRGTTRRVFNNIFVQIEGMPGLNFTGASADDDFQADANLLWGVKDRPAQLDDFFTKFRKSPQFEASKKQYPPGWGANDRVGDPKFVSLENDFRLQPGSAAIDTGVAIPSEWPDTLREIDSEKPDLGAFPFGAEPLRVGSHPQ